MLDWSFLSLAGGVGTINFGVGQLLGGDVGMLPFFQITGTAQPGPSEWSISEWGQIQIAPGVFMPGMVVVDSGTGVPDWMTYTFTMQLTPGTVYSTFRVQLSAQSDCERPDDFQCTADAMAENTADVKILSDYISGNNYQYVGCEDTSAAPIPEPSTAALIAIGLLLAAAKRTRRTI